MDSEHETVPPAGDQQRVLRVLAQLVQQQPVDRVQQQAPGRPVHPDLFQLRRSGGQGPQALRPAAGGPDVLRFAAGDVQRSGAGHRTGPGQAVAVWPAQPAPGRARRPRSRSAAPLRRSRRRVHGRNASKVQEPQEHAMIKSEDKKVDTSRKEPGTSALPSFLAFLPSSLPVLLPLPVAGRRAATDLLQLRHDPARRPPICDRMVVLQGRPRLAGRIRHLRLRFLSLGFYQSWLGAAIIVLAGLGLAELTRRHLVKAGLASASIPALLPAIALFLIYSDYKHPLPMVLAVSSGLLLSLLFERLPLRRPGARIAGFCLMAAVGFWLGGAGSLAGRSRS